MSRSAAVAHGCTSLREPQSAQAYLEASLRRLSMRRPARQAEQLCPALGQVMLRMAYFVTDVPTRETTGRPILDCALDAGLVAFFSGPSPAAAGATRFLRYSLAQTSDLVALAVRCGPLSWDAWEQQSLGDWLADAGAYRVERKPAISDPATRAFRAHLLDRFTRPEELLALGADQSTILQPPR